MEPENLQSVLQEAGILIDMQTLQSPTEDFMIYLIIEYLKKFNFDGNEITKSTSDQLNCLSCPDLATDAVKTVNLFSALSSVCHEIFLQDLSLTDISSPGPKRARRLMKILFNFLAYVKNKMAENETAFIELNNQQKTIEKLHHKKESVVAKTAAIIHNQKNKLEFKHHLNQEIDTVHLDIEGYNKKSKELEKHVKDVMLQNQTIFKKSCSLKAKAVKLHKEKTELQSRIVTSPEEYAARSKELEKLLVIKKEERQVLNDSITKKRLQIKNNENAQELVKDLNEKFSSNTCETFERLKETSKKLESVQKELDLLKKDIANWSKIDQNNFLNISNNKDLVGNEKLLFELENQYATKERELLSIKNHLKVLNSELSSRKTVLENESKTIITVQKKNLGFVKQYHKYFENQISEELSLRETVMSVVLKNGCIKF